jgi:signal transduction histidine kinase
MAGLKALLLRCLPDTLFGRLALLLVVVVLISHGLALTLMFELRPPIGPGLDHLPPPHKGPPPEGLLMDIGIRLAALWLAAWVAARWLAEPVRRLADAARELGLNMDHKPLPETGTRECREASRVFNQMQQRLQAQMAQRDQFVAAVSHDLRTPLTRLALRAESLQDPLERKQFGRDIAEMDTMIRVTLDYLRGAAEAEPRVMLDLGSLVDSLVQDQQDCGHDVATAVPLPHLRPLYGQTSALRRCIANLLDNAVRYGGSARVGLTEESEDVVITVRDRGPGIAPDELERVLLPFYRVDASRNRNSGGVGLGLATASDIARQHGGQLVLRNREGGGLQVELRLPRKGLTV